MGEKKKATRLAAGANFSARFAKVYDPLRGLIKFFTLTR